MLLSALMTVVIARVADAMLLDRPDNVSALVGTAVTLRCQTNITSRPVNWYCTGTCSANTSAASVYLLMLGQLTEVYSDRVDVITDHTQYVRHAAFARYFGIEIHGLSRTLKQAR